MRELVLVLAGGLLVGACSVPAAVKTETVTGQVVDIACYARDKANTGHDHDRGRECALACSKWEGQPVGLVAVDGKVYQVAGGLVADNNARIIPHLTHTVTVTGEVYEKDGMMMIAANDLKMTK